MGSDFHYNLPAHMILAVVNLVDQRIVCDQFGKERIWVSVESASVGYSASSRSDDGMGTGSVHLSTTLIVVDRAKLA